MNLEEYDKMYELEDHYWWFVGRRRLALNLLRHHIGSATNPRVLDLGCGTGVVLRELESWTVPLGLDMSSLALSYCRKRGIRNLVKGDGIMLPFDENSVDAIIGLDIFEHIEDDRAAFLEAFRVLKPGGSLVLSVPAYKLLWGPHDIALMHFRRYRKAELRQSLQAAGLRIDRLSYSVFLLFPVVLIWRMAEKLKKGPAKASLVALPPWLNQSLIRLQDFEARLISSFDLPYGSSVIAVAHKPA